MAKSLDKYSKLPPKQIFLRLYKACANISGKRGAEAGYLVWSHMTRCASILRDFYASDYGGGVKDSDKLDAYFSLGALHDVGKLLVKDKLLLKRKLNKKDWEAMKEHQSLDYVHEAFEVNLGIEFRSVPDDIKEVATRHHELMNGLGYSGLGLEIGDYPRDLKAIMIIDKFEAGTSYLRPWQKRKRYMQIFTEFEKAMQRGELEEEMLFSIYSLLFNDSITHNLTCLPRIVGDFYAQD